MLRNFTKNISKSFTLQRLQSFRTTQIMNSELSKFNDSFLGGSNADFIDNLFNKWAEDPTSVNASWDNYFKNLVRGVEPEQAFSLPPNDPSQGIHMAPDHALKIIVSDNLKARLLIDAYRIRGHEIADLDPLQMNEELLKAGKPKVTSSPKLHHTDFGFTDADLDKEVYINDGRVEGVTNVSSKSTWKLRELIDHLKHIYCNKVGYQYMHINNKAERDWIRQKIENSQRLNPTKEQLIKTADRLCRDYCFTEFLNNTFSTSKRFGSEGCDSFISGLGAMVDYAAEKKIENIIIGMPHRGRLNTLYSVLKKPADNILAEFQDLNIAKFDEENWGNSGDVKYHLGTTHDKKYGDHTIRLVRIQDLLK